MRGGDLNQWDWTHIDLENFAECTVPRAKTKRPQVLAVPEAVAVSLRSWWERAGTPTSGPVFPTRRDGRTSKAGTRRKSSGGLAERLRRALFRAGVVRLPPIEVLATKPGGRTDLGKPADAIKLTPNPRDPLYFETDTTRPVDFHSFRRAFATGLAEAGVGAQQAMHLAAHADAKVHARYVMGTKAMRQVPSAALPSLPLTALPVAASANDSTSATVSEGPRIVTARDESAEQIENPGGRSRDRTAVVGARNVAKRRENVRIGVCE